MEYQVAHALRENGHEIHLIGVRDDLGELIRRITEWKPELVFNCCEGFGGDDNLEYVVPSMLEALGVCYVGSPPLGLLVSRNKAMSKKVLAYHGIQVPGFVTCHPGEARPTPATSASRSSSSRCSPTPRGDLPGVGGPGRRRPRRAGRVRSRAVPPARHRRGVRGGAGALREPHRQRRQARDPADHGDGVRQGEEPPRGADRHQVRQVGRGLPGAAGNPEPVCPPRGGADPREDRAHLPHRLPRAVAAGLRPLRRATRARRPGVVARGQRQSLHQLRTRHGRVGREGRAGLHRADPAAGRDGPRATRPHAGWPLSQPGSALSAVTRSSNTGTTAPTAIAPSAGATDSESPAPSVTTAAGWSRTSSPGAPGAGPTSTRRASPARSRSRPRGASGWTPAATGAVAAASVSDGALSLVRRAAAMERGQHVRGRLPPLRPRRGRLDGRLPLVRQRRHRAGPHPARPHPLAPAAAGLPDQALGLSGAAPARRVGRGPEVSQDRRDRAALRRRPPAG